MSESIATLHSEVTAGAGGFYAVLDEAQKRWNGFAKKLTIGAAIGAGIGAGMSGFNLAKNGIQGMAHAMVENVTQQAEVIDQSAKMADSLGASTENMAALRVQAELSGSSLEGAAKAINHLNRTIGEAANGSKEARDIFARMGLSPESLANMDSVDALGVIADKTKAYTNAAQRAADLQAIFGKGAAELAPLLLAGSDGLRESAQHAQAYGLATSRIDAAKVEQANDSVTLMQMAWAGIGTQLAVGIAPYVTRINTDLQEMVGHGAKMGGLAAGIQPVLKDAVGWVGDLKDGFKTIMAIQGVLKSGNVYGIVTGKFQKSLGALTGDALRGGPDTGTQYVKWMNDAGIAAEKLAAEMSKANKNKRDLEASAATSPVSFIDQEALKKAAKNWESLADIFDQIGGELDGMQFSSFDLLIAKAEALGATVDQMKVLVGWLREIEDIKAEEQRSKDFANQWMTRGEESVRTAQMVHQEYASAAEQMSDLQEKLADAVAYGGLSLEEAGRYAADKHASLGGLGADRHAALIESGSAQSQLLRFDSGRDETLEQRKLDYAKETAESLKEMLRIQRDQQTSAFDG